MTCHRTLGSFEQFQNALFFRGMRSSYIFTPHDGQICSIPDHHAWDSNTASRYDAICRALGCRALDRIEIGFTTEEVIDAIDHQLAHLTLGVTQDCNFRCDYCIYSGEFSGLRSHSRTYMSEDTAIASADYLVAHCSQARKDLFCTFYGGEPFLNFPVIRSTVDHLSHVLKERIRFSVTTNGSLLDREVRRFLIDNRIFLSISIDGDRESHDRHRRFCDGRPTFDHVIACIDKLRHEDEAYFNLYVTFAVTLTGDTDYLVLDEFFSRYPNNVKVSGVMFYGSQTIRPVRGNSRNISLMIEKFLEGCRTRAFDNEESRQPYRFASSVISRGLRAIHNRRVAETVLFDGTYALTKHCIPGATKLFVAPDGVFYPCEKLDSHTHLAIGDFEHGVDKETVMRLLHEYLTLRDSHCRECYLIDICDYCFQSASDGHGWDEQKMELHCEYAREEYARAFSLYAQILEEDGSALDFLDNQPDRFNR